MRKIVTKSNEWYDSLPENKRFLYFMAFIMCSLLIVEGLFYLGDFLWAIPMWIIAVCTWRVPYIYFKNRNK